MDGGTVGAAVLSTSLASTAAHQVSIPIALEFLAVIVASAYGVFAARENHLDFIGAIVLAVACALGGGIIRDVILQEGDVYILRQPLATPVSIATATVVFVFPTIFEKPERLMSILDIFSVGLFAVIGADKTMVYGYDPIICVMMGFFTAVGGGLLRDMCLGKVPYIFQRGNLYAIAAIVGAIIYLILIETFHVWNLAAAAAAVALTMVVRWASIHFNIMSPTEVDLGRAKRIVRPIARPIKAVGRQAAQSVSRVHKKRDRHES